MDNQFGILRNDIADIKTSIINIQEKINIHDGEINKISTLSNANSDRISMIESKLASLPSDISKQTDIFRELNERTRRLTNVIVFNLNENNGDNTENHIQKDKILIQ